MPVSQSMITGIGWLTGRSYRSIQTCRAGSSGTRRTKGRGQYAERPAKALFAKPLFSERARSVRLMFRPSARHGRLATALLLVASLAVVTRTGHARAGTVQLGT